MSRPGPAPAEYGVRMAYIFDIAGELGEPAAHATLEHALSRPPEALTGFGLAGIGHGISCLDDPSLVAWLRERQVPLEVCPTSNVCTRQVPDLALHPLPRLLAEGLFVTLNSDDPHAARDLGSAVYPPVRGRDSGDCSSFFACM